jgi:hypothetical protein
VIPDPSILQYVSIELAPVIGGQLFVGIVATLCEREGELESMDLGTERLASLDDALAFVRATLTHIQ